MSGRRGRGAGEVSPSTDTCGAPESNVASLRLNDHVIKKETVPKWPKTHLTPLASHNFHLWDCRCVCRSIALVVVVLFRKAAPTCTDVRAGSRSASKQILVLRKPAGVRACALNPGSR